MWIEQLSEGGSSTATMCAACYLLAAQVWHIVVRRLCCVERLELVEHSCDVERECGRRGCCYIPLSCVVWCRAVSSQSMRAIIRTVARPAAAAQRETEG